MRDTSANAFLVEKRPISLGSSKKLPTMNRNNLMLFDTDLNSSLGAWWKIFNRDERLAIGIPLLDLVNDLACF